MRHYARGGIDGQPHTQEYINMYKKPLTEENMQAILKLTEITTTKKKKLGKKSNTLTKKTTKSTPKVVSFERKKKAKVAGMLPKGTVV